ncbi:MAG: VOC family protein [Candidatus Sericytochromatia bacterium]
MIPPQTSPSDAPQIALTHIALRAQNPSLSAAFYARYCQLSVVQRRVDQENGQDVEVIWLGNPERLPGFVIVLMQAKPEPAPQSAFHHLGFEVSSRDEVDALAKQAQAEGILALPPQDAGPVVGYICALSDPDGNLVEISFGQMIMLSSQLQS